MTTSDKRHGNTSPIIPAEAQPLGLLWKGFKVTNGAPLGSMNASAQQPAESGAASSVPAPLAERTSRAVAALTEAIRYLQDNWIVSPKANQSTTPPPQVTQILTKNHMCWKWNDVGGLWEPRLRTSDSQSIFQANPQYLDFIKDKGTAARNALVEAAIKTLSVLSNPQSLDTRTADEQAIFAALTGKASMLFGRKVECNPKGVATLMRAHALYTFLKTEEDRLFPPSTDDDD
jgi:hypothetical protein